MDSTFSELRRLFLIVLVVLAGGWMLTSSMGHAQLVERGFVLAPTLAWYYPFDLPRWMGVIFFLILAGEVLRSEYKARPSSADEEALGITLFAYFCFIGVAGVVTSIAYVTGAWLSLLLAAIAVWKMRETMEGRTVYENAIIIALGISCAVGIWTGLMNGLIHGLFAAMVHVVYVLVHRKERLFCPKIPGLST